MEASAVTDISQPAAVLSSCAVRALSDGDRLDWRRTVDHVVQRPAVYETSNLAVNWAHCSHVAAIVLSHSGQILDCDCRGSSFVRVGNVLRIVDGQLCCSDKLCQTRFGSALKETAVAGRTTNMLLYATDLPGKRFSLTLAKTRQRLESNNGCSHTSDVLCLVASLDGRRIATARQLMDIFGLSAAEARLSRAICHGESVEEYARDQGLQMPTIRTQLGSIFKKTGCERQVTLVRLITGIPVVRDPV
jgi:DNA-binding CsgD family transcriptional regulator